jgi:hypothetical protein
MDEDFNLDGIDDEELYKYVDRLKRIISKNSPERETNAKPHEIKWHGVVVSPHPGNLKNHGNVIQATESGYTLRHGYRPAPYALYANKKSRKPNYIEKSIQEFKSFLAAKGWSEDDEE